MPVGQVAYTLNDLLYGRMLCWAMGGGAYSFEERTKEFCQTYLDTLLKPYLIWKGCVNIMTTIETVK